MPKNSVYGGWPMSGEIDIMELRGNRNLFDGNTNVGVEQTGSTMVRIEFTLVSLSFVCDNIFYSILDPAMTSMDGPQLTGQETNNLASMLASTHTG